MREDTSNTIIQPFLKWVGGKRWLVEQYLDLIPRFEGRYIEPFLGSGAIFFALQPRKAVLADRNSELIDAYRAIRDNHAAVQRFLGRHAERHCSTYYYQIRKERPRSISASAARLIYLNRTCWNGLYRVNRRGEFNVPIGTRNDTGVIALQLSKIAKTLARKTIQNSDFEPIIKMARRGDLIFADPPYTVHHNENGFIKYNKDLFSWADQLRLRDSLVRAAKRGAKVVATNAAHSSIHELYSGSFQIKEVRRPSTIAAESRFRGNYKELLITSK